MRISAIVTAIAFAALALVAAPLPEASAAGCPSGSLCQYSGAGFSGTAKVVTLNTKNFRNYCGPAGDPSTRSVINNTNVELLFSSGSNCGGGQPYRYVGPGKQVADLGFDALSVTWCPSC
ncbi:peptidase inhibitor family I36 protein [Nocardia implantans]|uniref:Peptidase inhibitor family I36 protein n=1 Tax=Nocardia implantans TaxID=3108168 RepID=A0ABU6AUY4_9NOCA|nr:MULTISPECIES: peptidase inhibitor family I36 protein [unclassified Nocardia]MBF6192667.1 peptidase inhibitor family I36 protein [Nocardia beijingensis]MEA3527425.1 peptidase inhibitor family I36 protein [Nocardia sp. CDC192]MEB3511133.1 peptidase inhibitor family I36 protein [Nocardia sp. CDC186]